MERNRAPGPPWFLLDLGLCDNPARFSSFPHPHGGLESRQSSRRKVPPRKHIRRGRGVRAPLAGPVTAAGLAALPPCAQTPRPGPSYKSPPAPPWSPPGRGARTQTPRPDARLAAAEPENDPGCLLAPPRFSAPASGPRLFKAKTVLPMPVALGGLFSVCVGGGGGCRQRPWRYLGAGGGHARSADPRGGSRGRTRGSSPGARSARRRSARVRGDVG